MVSLTMMYDFNNQQAVLDYMYPTKRADSACSYWTAAAVSYESMIFCCTCRPVSCFTCSEHYREF
jgi:hypothetical protein